MVIFPLSLIYVLCAFGVGYLGRTTRIGWIGVTLLAFLLTPLFMLIAVILLRTVDRAPATPAAE